MLVVLNINGKWHKWLFLFTFFFISLASCRLFEMIKYQYITQLVKSGIFFFFFCARTLFGVWTNELRTALSEVG
jgi:hypothetical protein